MTAKEKAIEIYDEMKGFRVKNSHRKKCALAAVDMITDALETTTGHLAISRMDMLEVEKDFDFWEHVKTEIEKL